MSSPAIGKLLDSPYTRQINSVIRNQYYGSAGVSPSQFHFCDCVLLYVPCRTIRHIYAFTLMSIYTLPMLHSDPLIRLIAADSIDPRGIRERRYIKGTQRCKRRSGCAGMVIEYIHREKL
jgi:hypothetical protein